MRQKISVRAIVRNGGKTLLLRRRGGRPSIAGKYELPGGGIEAREQPTDALKRMLRQHAGLAPETVQLFDTVSFIDPDDRELQYVFIVYLVGLPSGGAKVTLDNEHDKFTWKTLSELQHVEITESTRILLSLEKRDESRNVVENTNEKRVVKSTTNHTKDDLKNRVIVYSDGGSRGNPGPSAAGFVIMDEGENVIFEGGEYLGVTTNNLAEYQAVALALERAHALGAETVDFRSDSLLVVNQMNGLFQIRNRELWPIHDRITELIKKFDHVRFTHVNREYNRLADGLVNKILDESKLDTKNVV